MKLWEKNFEVNKEIERFTVGRDREMDLYLAKYDVLGSIVHHHVGKHRTAGEGRTDPAAY